MSRFCSYGGGIHHTAIIGGLPELREWRPGDPVFEPIVHETARVHAFVTVDAGGHRPTLIGARTWLMAQTHVGHDAQVGADCEIAPHATIGGEVILQDGVKIGMNVCVRPGIVIGEGARIGAGSVVTKNVPAGEVWCGNPARPLGSNSADGFGRDGQSIAKMTAA